MLTYQFHALHCWSICWDCPFGPLFFTSSFGHLIYNYATTDVMTWWSFVIQTCSKILLGWEKVSSMDHVYLWVCFGLCFIMLGIALWIESDVYSWPTFSLFSTHRRQKIWFIKRILVFWLKEYFFFAQHRFLFRLLFWILVKSFTDTRYYHGNGCSGWLFSLWLICSSFSIMRSRENECLDCNDFDEVLWPVVNVQASFEPDY